MEERKDDILEKVPDSEPQRQYYYMEKAKGYVAAISEKLGHPMTFCVTTFAVLPYMHTVYFILFLSFE